LNFGQLFRYSGPLCSATTLGGDVVTLVQQLGGAAVIQLV